MAVDALARALAAGKVPVSAYEMAVKAGYTGTKEQFAEDMGNSGTNATNAAASASAAAASATLAANAATNFAPVYSDSSTYAVGDYVLYEGTLYQCNTAITTAEAWNAEHWTATKLAPEVGQLEKKLYSGLITNSASGPVVSFTYGSDGIPVSALTAGIEAVQEGSGTPAEDNVRPLSGWTGAKIRRTDRNLWGGDALLADVKDALPNAQVDADARTVSFPGNITLSHRILGGDRNYGVRFKSGQQYTFILTLHKNNGNRANLRLIYTDGTYIDWAISSAEVGQKVTAVYVTAAGKTVAGVGKVNYSGTVTLYADECGLFEGVVTAEDFVPYDGAETDVEFPEEAEEVYGGVLDVTAGTLTVTHGEIASYAGETLPGAWISDRDVYAPGTSPSVGAQVVYRMSDPVTYQLTPSQMTTFLGENYIWANCGNVGVIYNANTKMYIDAENTADRAMIAVVSVETASRTYAVGEFLAIGETLYKVTAVITSGESITPGVNVEATTVGEQLTALFNLINS